MNAGLRGFGRTKSLPQSQRPEGGAAAETKDVCTVGGRKVSEGCVCFFPQALDKPPHGTAGQKQVEATGAAAAAAWAALLVHCSWRLRRLS